MNKDHDTLIEMCQIMKSHVNNFDGLSRDFKEHQILDEQRFSEQKKDILGVQKAVWMAAGAIVMVQLVPAVSKILHLFQAK